MGQTTFGEPLNYKVSQNAAAIEADEEAMAILATGDTHVAIEAGKYVYVRDHSTLARGLYKNTSGSTIAANDPLSSSNLTATTEGGLNELNSKMLKVSTKTGTTSATTGILDLGVASTVNVVGANAGPLAALPYFANGSWRVIVIDSSSANGIVAVKNTEVTVTFYFYNA